MSTPRAWLQRGPQCSQRLCPPCSSPHECAVSPQSHRWSASSGSPARLGSCCLLGDSRSEVVMTTMLGPIKCSTCIIAEACFWLGILLLLSNSVLSWSFVCVKLLQPCLTLCYPMDCSPPGSFVHGDSPSKITGMGCHAFLCILPGSPDILDSDILSYYFTLIVSLVVGSTDNLLWKLKSITKTGD